MVTKRSKQLGVAARKIAITAKRAGKVVGSLAIPTPSDVWLLALRHGLIRRRHGEERADEGSLIMPTPSDAWRSALRLLGRSGEERADDKEGQGATPHA